jgi:hypothetical protein
MQTPDFLTIVLVHHSQILGVRECASHDEIWHGHQFALKASLADEGYSHLAISAHKVGNLTIRYWFLKLKKVKTCTSVLSRSDCISAA